MGKTGWLNEHYNEQELLRAVPHDVMASKSDEAISNSLDAVFKRPYSYMARLEVQYEINH